MENDKLHEKFVEYGKNAKEWMRKCVLLLPEIDRKQIWAKKGFGSIYEYAAKLAGMSRGQVEDALRILRKIEDKPALRKVVEKKGINSVRPVVTIATKENEGFWAEKAREMSKNTLSTYVREFRTSPESNKEEIDISMKLKPELANKLKKLKGDGEWNDLIEEFFEMREKQLEQEKPEKVETESRHIPAKIEKYVIKRSRGTCEYPGCCKPYEILHHTCRFALYKEHDPDTIFALCKGHERLFHQGLIENEHKPPEFWKICEKPDKNDPKFKIDLKVMRFRSVVRV
ncbi:hypothetical protein ACFL3C_03435 [Patescibacteria group bacterium]